MATISPSPDSAPSGVPPTDSSAPPVPSFTPPPGSPSTQSTPPSSAPPPSDLGPPAVTPPPAQSSPPPISSGVPPSPPVVPPPKTPPPVSQPPPLTPPPTSSPPPVSAPPPTPPASPPTGLPPPATTPPPTATPPPSANPPKSPPPSPPLRSPPEDSPPPPSSEPPSSSPPPPASTPPEESPTPRASQPPQSSLSPPDAPPPTSGPPTKDTPPSGGDSPPPSAPPPSTIPGTLSPPVFQSPPSPGAQISPPSPPSSSSNKSSSDAAQNANNASSKGGVGTSGEIAIGVIAGIVILGLIGLVILWFCKRRKRSSGANNGHVIPASIGSSPRSDINLLVKTEYPGSHFGGGSGADTPTDHGGFGQSRSWFTYNELSAATGGFSDENLLGEGGFGCVYKGLLPDGRVIAVKQLKIGGGQGEREFRAEVEIISRIHHRHLVSLVGYCIWESRRLLVYEYVANDTLHFHLHGGGTPIIDWATRVKIALGAARGIAYLHEDCHPRIIHRDIKSSNILLDNNFEARVSDFGLAKLALDADTHVSTRVMGTFGYLAPEYATTGKLTEKSDVYSFGVVLLELITGRKPVDESQPLGDESLVEWARPLLAHAIEKGELEAVVDPRLEKNYIETEMLVMIEAAAACVRHSSSKRPRMGQVVRALSLSETGDLSNGLRVGESQLHNTAQQSAEIRWFRRMAFGSQDSGSDIFSNPSQNAGFSAQGRQGEPARNAAQSWQNVNFSALDGQVGNISRQHSQDSQNIAFPSQTGSNVSASSEHGLGSNISRQQGYNPHHST